MSRDVLQKKDNDIKKESFINTMPSFGLIHAGMSLFYFIVWIIAIFLSFKCNGGFDIFGFLGACLCPFIYIPYKLILSNEGCF